ncbi:MAG: response regulator [Candidatus Levybacteria bacterium]|nr:response regulator [Candidatus Levybacteria bacterium]
MRILIIEDDKFFQNFYALKLTEQGFVIDVASDGEEGLQKLHTTKPDLILLDLIMPKKDGFQILEAMSKDPTLKKIPVLVFSTLGQEQDIEKAKKLGAVDYINKSFFDFTNLIAKINGILQKGQVRNTQ